MGCQIGFNLLKAIPFFLCGFHLVWQSNHSVFSSLIDLLLSMKKIRKIRRGFVCVTYLFSGEWKWVERKGITQREKSKWSQKVTDKSINSPGVLNQNWTNSFIFLTILFKCMIFVAAIFINLWLHPDAIFFKFFIQYKHRLSLEDIQQLTPM